MASDDEVFDYQCQFYRPNDCEHRFDIPTTVGTARARGSRDLCSGLVGPSTYERATIPSTSTSSLNPAIDSDEAICP